MILRDPGRPAGAMVRTSTGQSGVIGNPGNLTTAEMWDEIEKRVGRLESMFLLSPHEMPAYLTEQS